MAVEKIIDRRSFLKYLAVGGGGVWLGRYKFPAERLRELNKVPGVTNEGRGFLDQLIEGHLYDLGTVRKKINDRRDLITADRIYVSKVEVTERDPDGIMGTFFDWVIKEQATAEVPFKVVFSTDLRVIGQDQIRVGTNKVEPVRIEVDLSQKDTFPDLSTKNKAEFKAAFVEGRKWFANNTTVILTVRPPLLREDLVTPDLFNMKVSKGEGGLIDWIDSSVVYGYDTISEGKIIRTAREVGLRNAKRDEDIKARARRNVAMYFYDAYDPFARTVTTVFTDAPHKPITLVRAIPEVEVNGNK